MQLQVGFLSFQSDSSKLMSESGERSPEETAPSDTRRSGEERYSPRHLIEQQLRTAKYFTVECRGLIERLVGDALLPQTQATGNFFKVRSWCVLSFEPMCSACCSLIGRLGDCVLVHQCVIALADFLHLPLNRLAALEQQLHAARDHIDELRRELRATYSQTAHFTLQREPLSLPPQQLVHFCRECTSHKSRDRSNVDT